MAAKKTELKPTMEKFEVNKEKLELLKQSLLNGDNKDFSAPSRENTDNFFRAVIGEMLNNNNISLKTEYMNVNENFAGAKLEFLSQYANMPYLKDFIKILETKRVSLNRKSRIELIKAFEKRDEEIQAQSRADMLKGMFAP